MEKVQTDTKIWAIIAYFIFFLPILAGSAGVKKDIFVRFHVRQGLGLFITIFILKFFSMFFVLPLFSSRGIVSSILPPAINIFILTLLILGIMNVLRGDRKPLPLIGTWVDKHLNI